MSQPSRHDHGGPRRAPVQERSRQTVARLLEAAQGVIEDEGPDALTTTSVAERAGVSPASLYRFFANRDELFDALLVEQLAETERLTEEQEQTWDVTSAADFVDRQFDLHVEFYERNPAMTRLWFEGRGSPVVTAAVREYNLTLATRGRQALVDAGVRIDDVPLKASVLLVELGDRVLELAFRDGATADREVIELGRTALFAYLERIMGVATP